MSDIQALRIEQQEGIRILFACESGSRVVSPSRTATTI
ncbi:hypothetical protein E6C60_0977 [Paenibacillus algicola]|uniref:Uncharacterized protein n=1 Tax=Paenibacillus algicola TaxID=2565926 RepID=A0A4P8XH63_9BACL|nr:MULTISPECIES: nucleotidyltransferase domain-containing protein [Paenibacillus]QCT01695.1 hypothetical protein E6C60_0977 [Paenibacillus algicola]